MTPNAMNAFTIGSYRTQYEATSIPRLFLPPAPDSHRQARQRYRTRPIHPELVGYRPLGLRAILTGRVVEETHAKYGLILLSISLASAEEDELKGTLEARMP